MEVNFEELAAISSQSRTKPFSAFRHFDPTQIVIFLIRPLIFLYQRDSTFIINDPLLANLINYRDSSHN
jgi:hypothetical protein